MRKPLTLPLRVAGAVALVQLTGCASIVTGTTQSLAVETRTYNGQEVMGANCRLTNSKGTWFVTTPGSVTIHRATASPLAINCNKEGQQQLGVASIKPKSKGMTWGNLLFGGVIGVITDGVTGAAGYYPSPITVIMEAITTAAAATSALQTPGVTATNTSPATEPPAPQSAPLPQGNSAPTTDWRNWGSQNR